MPDVSILIINYNTADLVKKCIQSVLKQKNITREVIVIDNASCDNSIATLQAFHSDILFIANTDNIGFGRANNQAYRLSKGRYLFLLNPDAEFITEYDLHDSIQFMENNPSYGLIGTKILDSDNQPTLSASNRYPRQNKTTADFSQLPGEWATVLGASMLVRREVYQKINGFDEDFFLYAEETDLCLRIRKQGYWIGYYEDVAVRHIGSASERKNPPEEVARKKKRGKYLFYTKHYPKEDVIKLLKEDLRHARFHLLRLAIIKKLGMFNKANAMKQARHQVSKTVAQEFLEKCK